MAPLRSSSIWRIRAVPRAPAKLPVPPATTQMLTALVWLRGPLRRRVPFASRTVATQSSPADSDPK